MKKIISLILTGIMTLSLAGCGSTNTNANNAASESAEQTEQTEQSDNTAVAETDNDNAETNDPTGKTLVVYFSASGNTKRVAELVASEMSADLFEIVPAEPYTDDDLNWMNRSSRVCKEHDDESLQNIELVTTEVPNWDEYDNVVIGYPLWWREAAWPVNNFIKGNDFTGKTVIPFCTSTSSGFGDSGKLLEEMAGAGDWLEGVRFSENESDDSIIEWAQGLDLE